MNTWQIKDLTGVGDVQLELDDSKHVFVLFGSNGVGKTKTLEALLLFILGQIEDFSLPYSIKKTNKYLQSIQYNHQNLILDNQSPQEYLYLPAIYDVYVQEKPFQAIAFLGASQRGQVDCQTSQQTIFHLIGDAIEKNNLRNLSMNNNIHQWFIEKAQSVNPYQKKEDNRKIDIDTVLNALHKIDSRIEKTLNIDGEGHVFLTIEGQERELSELSSGFISVVKIIQSIISSYSAFTNTSDLLNVKGVVLIDEIESHLHLEWQVKIIPTLKKLFPNTIFYIATHSPLVLSQLEEGEAYLLQRDDDGVVRSKMVNSPNKRILANVLRDTFGIDLNQLKRQSMEHSDQSKAKQRLLALLNEDSEGDNE